MDLWPWFITFTRHIHRTAILTGLTPLFGGLWLLGGLCPPAIALDPGKSILQYALRNWQVEDGLPQGSVTEIVQAEDGALWLGTRGGVVRFDGSLFTTFERQNTPAFHSDSVWDLTLDAHGGLWAGTDDGLLHYADGVWTRLGKEDGLPETRILSVEGAADGGVWFGTYDHGLGYFKDGSFQFLDREDGLFENSVWILEVDSAGDLWLGTFSGGVQHYADGEFTSYPQLPRYGTWEIQHDPETSALWVGTNHGLARLQDGEMDLYTVDEGLPHNMIKAVALDRDGHVWVGTHGGGLARISPDGRITSMQKADGLASNEIDSLLEDREGHLWIGTLGGGLHRLRDGPVVPFGPPEGIPGQQVCSIYEAPNGHLYIATFQSGIHILGPDGIVGELNMDSGLSTNRVFAVLGDRRGNLWVGTSGHGIERVRDGEVTSLTTEDGLVHNVVLALHEGQDGSIWIGTNGGLSRLAVDGTWTSFTVDDGLPNLVRALHEDDQGVLWIGTTEGLSRLEDGRFTHITREDGLSGSIVWTIHEDRHGVFWIGTSGGLDRLENGKLTSYGIDQGLQDTHILEVLEDDLGGLWLGTQRGLLRLDRRQLNRYAVGEIDRIDNFLYTKTDGMRDGETFGGTRPSGWKGRDGRLWFPTYHGVAMIDPAKLRPTGSGPASRIEGLTVDGEPYLGRLNASRVTLGPEARRLDFSFSALSLGSPHRLQFRYRLLGFDEWTIAQPGQRQVSYTNIPAGEYSLEIAARHEDGIWNNDPARLELVLKPYFYQTGWFYLVCLLSGLGLIAAIPTLRIYRLQKSEQELAARVEQALEQIKALRGMIPICASCKNIRDDAGYWKRIEAYISEYADVRFSHGLCPDCVQQYYPHPPNKLPPQEEVSAPRVDAPANFPTEDI